MKFYFRNLDDQTRAVMKEEIYLANSNGEIYFSARFNAIGSGQWIAWLTEAAQSYDEHWLAYQIEAAGGMRDFEGRAKPTGGYAIAHVPHTASETMAEGQFNRFYIAAICKRAIDEGLEILTVYRARLRGEPRPESRALEGTVMDPRALLEQVRNKQSSFKCELLKPNSGLSVHL